MSPPPRGCACRWCTTPAATRRSRRSPAGGVIDIWLPDAKYADDVVAQRLSGFPRYVAHNRAALQEIFRQVGDELLLDEEGIARRGLIIRHLVLPDGLADTPGSCAGSPRPFAPRLCQPDGSVFPAYQVLDDPSWGARSPLTSTRRRWMPSMRQGCKTAGNRNTRTAENEARPHLDIVLQTLDRAAGIVLKSHCCMFRAMVAVWMPNHFSCVSHVTPPRQPRKGGKSKLQTRPLHRITRCRVHQKFLSVSLKEETPCHVKFAGSLC